MKFDHSPTSQRKVKIWWKWGKSENGISFMRQHWKGTNQALIYHHSNYERKVKMNFDYNILISTKSY